MLFGEELGARAVPAFRAGVHGKIGAERPVAGFIVGQRASEIRRATCPVTKHEMRFPFVKAFNFERAAPRYVHRNRGSMARETTSGGGGASRLKRHLGSNLTASVP